MTWDEWGGVGVGRVIGKTKGLPLINTDDTDRKSKTYLGDTGNSRTIGKSGDLGIGNPRLTTDQHR